MYVTLPTGIFVGNHKFDQNKEIFILFDMKTYKSFSDYRDSDADELISKILKLEKVKDAFFKGFWIYVVAEDVDDWEKEIHTSLFDIFREHYGIDSSREFFTRTM